ncbi:MAG: hypothetical protein NW215_14940 [Hyphomicrobiales bacterium]|nr:hypothetical protein [Hyphomicrobiales bacterium]
MHEARTPPTQASAHVEAVLDRLEAALDGETAALRAGGVASLQPFIDIKTQSLLTLSQLPGGQLIHAKRLAALRAKLDANARMLAMHAEAVSEVATIIAAAMEEQSSDRTYTSASHRKRA